jgi:hypothetical protein
MKNGKTYLILASIALAVACVAIPKAASAFQDFQANHNAAYASVGLSK